MTHPDDTLPIVLKSDTVIVPCVTLAKSLLWDTPELASPTCTTTSQYHLGSTSVVSSSVIRVKPNALHKTQTATVKFNVKCMLDSKKQNRDDVVKSWYERCTDGM